jgi:hypothetical protein
MINNNDYSMYVKSLKVKNITNYNSQTNAAGNTVVDKINVKRQIEVGIIPLSATATQTLLTDLSGFNVTLSFLNPYTNAIEANVNCIIPDTDISYYTIQANNVRVNEFSLTFTEL